MRTWKVTTMLLLLALVLPHAQPALLPALRFVLAARALQYWQQR